MELEAKRVAEAKTENERKREVVEMLKTRDREKRENMFENIARSLQVAEKRRLMQLEKRKSVLKMKHSKVNDSFRETKQRRLEYSEILHAKLARKQAQAAARRECNVKNHRKRKRDIHETKRRRARLVRTRERDRSRSLERQIEARVEKARMRRIQRLRNIRANAHAVFERLLASSPQLQSRQSPKIPPPLLTLSSTSCSLPTPFENSKRTNASVKIQRWIRLLQRCKALRSKFDVFLRSSFDVVEQCRKFGPSDDDNGCLSDLFSSCGFEDFAKRVKEASVRIAAREIIENCSSFERSSSYYQKARQFLVAILISKFPRTVSSKRVTRCARELDNAFSALSKSLCEIVEENSSITTLLQPLQRFDLSLNSFCITFAIWLREDRIRLLQDAAASIKSIDRATSTSLSRTDVVGDDDHIISALESIRESIQRDVIDVISPHSSSSF